MTYTEYLIKQRFYATKELIDIISKDFIQEVSKIKRDILKIGMTSDFSDISIFVVIKDDDEVAERNLIRIEAIINGKYYSETGIHIDISIYEQCDDYGTPKDYNIINL